MPTKIFIGVESEVLAQLAKEKASWEKNEKAAEGVGKAIDKAEQKAIAHGRNLVKQNRTAEQALKDRVAAVQAAGKAGEISAEEEKRTVSELIRKYKEEGKAAEEAARKGTEAYKEEQRQIKASTRQVDQMRDVKNETFGEKAKQQILQYAGSFTAISKSIDIVREALQFFNEEKKEALAATETLVDARRSLAQVSNGDFQELEKRANSLTRYGIDGIQARNLVFAARSEGFEGEEEVVAAADPVVKVEDGAKFAGSFRKVFSSDNLSVEQALNTALSGAAQSKFNISEILPQIQTAAQGEIDGGESSDVVAAVSTLAVDFGRSTGDRLRQLGLKLAGNESTQGLNLIEGVEKLIENPKLAESILKDSSELKAVFAKFTERLGDIKNVDRRIEREQSLSGSEGLLGKKLEEILNPETESGRIEMKRRAAVSAEENLNRQKEFALSSDAASDQAERDSANALLLKNSVPGGIRFAVNRAFDALQFSGAATLALSRKRDQRAEKQAQEQTEILKNIHSAIKSNVNPRVRSIRGPLSNPDEDR